jgi:hypothetical protein
MSLITPLTGILSPLGSAMGGGGMPVEDAIWTQIVGCTAAGNDLTKTAASGWANAGACSTRAIASGDGYVQWKAPDPTSVRYMLGLSHGDTSQHFNDIDFALYHHTDGTLTVYENGVPPAGTVGTYVYGDTMQVWVISGVVYYYKNGVQLYQSLKVPTLALLIDSAIYTQGAVIEDVVLCGSNLAASGY